MPKPMPPILPPTPPPGHDGYVTVSQRIAAFWAAFPLGRIECDLVERTDRRVTVRARLYRTGEDAQPAATGFASEREGDGEINVGWCLENAETSAVGRALANLGFAASRVRAAGGDGPAREREADITRATVRLVREPAPASPPSSITAPDARAPGASPATIDSAVIQRAAAALLDAQLVLAQAERAGLPPARVAALRRALAGRSVPPSVSQRVEREARTWCAGHGTEVRGETLHESPGTTPPATGPDAM